MSLNAYARARDLVETPRAAECRLIGQLTGEMIAARDTGLSGAALMPVLHRNRELWSILAATCAMPDNALPEALRANIVSLALWVDRFTSSVMTGREKLDPLISVNRAIAEGLA